jgi:hypothetical protein
MAQKFTREVIDNSSEKDIVISAILSTNYLAGTAHLLKNTYIFQEPHIRLVLQWCLEHFKLHKEAPGKLIYDIFTSKQKGLSASISEGVETVLQHLNEKYLEKPDTYSDSYYIAKTKSYIEDQSLLKLAEEIKGHVVVGQADKAQRALMTYNKVDKVLSTGIDPFRDKEFIGKMFSAMKKSVIRFPYPALEELFKDVYRGEIIAVAGPAKRGKSFLMNQLGYYALYSGLNVAVFSFEMDSEVMGMRLFQNFMGQPRKDMEWEELIPYFDKENNIQYHKILKEGLDYSETLAFQSDLATYGNIGTFKFFDHHECGRKVSNICDALDRIEKYDGIKIDVVIIDYDKLLENEDGFKGSSYEGINDNWKDVKAKIAQDRNTLVVFGSQYGKEGAQNEVGPESASGSSRKFDYVSHWVSILATEAEKKAGIMRIDVLGRHDGFFKSDKVVCLQALSLARPILDARWQKDIPNYDHVVASHEEDKKEIKLEKRIDKKTQDLDDWVF